MKGVTRFSGRAFHHDVVSIHTPNEGSDVQYQERGVTFEKFQSTLPMKGVTLGEAMTGHIYEVSIHTPNEGSDIGMPLHNARWPRFNPHSQ